MTRFIMLGRAVIWQSHGTMRMKKREKRDTREWETEGDIVRPRRFRHPPIFYIDIYIHTHCIYHIRKKRHIEYVLRLARGLEHFSFNSIHHFQWWTYVIHHQTQPDDDLIRVSMNDASVAITDTTPSSRKNQKIYPLKKLNHARKGKW